MFELAVSILMLYPFNIYCSCIIVKALTVIFIYPIGLLNHLISANQLLSEKF